MEITNQVIVGGQREKNKLLTLGAISRSPNNPLTGEGETMNKKQAIAYLNKKTKAIKNGKNDLLAASLNFIEAYESGILINDAFDALKEAAENEVSAL